MSEATAIEWADSTFNPWEGCQKAGPGCDNCYAEARNARFSGGQAVNWGPGAPRRRTSDANWKLPAQWQRQAAAFQAKHGRRRRVFCASLADWLDNEVPVGWLADLLHLVRKTPDLDWLLLSKRIGNWRSRLEAARDAMLNSHMIECWLRGMPPPNVWIGSTVVNQAEADRDVPKLLRVPAAVRFLSVEPTLGPIDLTNIPVGGGHGHHEFDPIITGNALRRADREAPHLHWVICGGESGPKARPMHPDWARSLRDQCAAASVPFLWKQWGEYLPVGQVRAPGAEMVVPRTGHAWDDGMTAWRIGKAAAGRLLDGRTHDEWPEVRRG